MKTSTLPYIKEAIHMAKRKIIQSAIDNLKEALQIFKTREAVGSRDKRSAKLGKKLVRELGKQYTDKEIAGSLEISRQKYTALKTQIKKGKIASSTLNDLLSTVDETIRETSGRPQDLTGVYYTETGKGVEGKTKFGIDYIQVSDDYIKKEIPWAEKLKRFSSQRDVLNYYGGATGGKEYFVIVKEKSGGWSMWDIRTGSEKSRKGSVGKELRAQRKIDRDRL